MTRFQPVFLTVAVAAALCWPLAPACGQPPAGVTFSYDLILQGNSTPSLGTVLYTPGQSLTAQVYLTQTGGASSYLASEGGLFQGGARLTFGNPTGTPGVLTVASVNDIALNTTSQPNTSAFNNIADSNATRVVTSDFAQFSPSTDASYGVLPDANGRILLGSVTFNTNALGGTTNLVLSDIPPSSFTDNLTLNATSLDPAISPVTLTFTPVPEPVTTLALGGVALMVGNLLRRIVGGSNRSTLAG